MNLPVADRRSAPTERPNSSLGQRPGDAGIRNYQFSVLPFTSGPPYVPGIKTSDLTRYVLLTAMVGCGAFGGWRSLGPGRFWIAGPESGTDTTGQALLGMPDFSTQLGAKLRGVPVNRALLVDGPPFWTTTDVVRLAACLLVPRPVAAFSGCGDALRFRNPAAVLFFRSTPAEASQKLPQPAAEAFGSDSSIVSLKAAP